MYISKHIKKKNSVDENASRDFPWDFQPVSFVKGSRVSTPFPFPVK